MTGTDLIEYKNRNKATVLLTSSFVVRLVATRYVWKPDRPKMHQTEKKQITSSTAVHGRVKKTKMQVKVKVTDYKCHLQKGKRISARTLLEDMNQAFRILSP